MFDRNKWLSPFTLDASAAQNQDSQSYDAAYRKPITRDHSDLASLSDSASDELDRAGEIYARPGEGWIPAQLECPITPRASRVQNDSETPTIPLQDWQSKTPPPSETTNSIVTMFGDVCEFLELERRHQLAIDAMKAETERKSMHFEEQLQLLDVKLRNESRERQRAEQELLEVEGSRCEGEHEEGRERHSHLWPEASDKCPSVQNGGSKEVEDSPGAITSKKNRCAKYELELVAAIGAQIEIQDLRDQLAPERKRREACERELAEVRNVASKKQAELYCLSTELEAIRKELDTELRRGTEYKSELDTHRQRAKDQLVEAQRLNEELDNVRAQLAEQRTMREDLLRDLDFEKRRSREYDAASKQREEDVQNLRSQLDDERLRVQHCKDELAEARGRLVAQDEAFREQESLLDRLQAELTEEREQQQTNISKLVDEGRRRAEREAKLESELRRAKDAFVEEQKARKESERKLKNELDQLRVTSSAEINRERELRSMSEMYLEDTHLRLNGDNHALSVIRNTNSTLSAQEYTPVLTQAAPQLREKCDMREDDEGCSFASFANGKSPPGTEVQDCHEDKAALITRRKAIAEVRNMKGELKSHCDLRAKRRGYANAELARQKHQMRELRERQKAAESFEGDTAAEHLPSKPKFNRPKPAKQNKANDCDFYVVGKMGLERHRMMYHLPGCAHLEESKTGCGHVFPMTFNEIRYMAHRPCPRCKPTPVSVVHNRLLS